MGSLPIQVLQENMEQHLTQLLLAIGIIQMKGKFSYVVNTDHYERLCEMYKEFCSGRITEENLLEQAERFKQQKFISW